MFCLREFVCCRDFSGCAPAKSEPFIRFDPVNDQWIPMKGSVTPIPLSIDDCSDHVKACIQRRKQGIGLMTNGDQVFTDEEGFLRGPVCIAAVEVCPACGKSLTVAEGDEWITVRTCVGAVKRLVTTSCCADCSLQFRWDPSHEGIHVINNGREGGECTVDFPQC